MLLALASVLAWLLVRENDEPPHEARVVGSLEGQQASRAVDLPEPVAAPHVARPSVTSHAPTAPGPHLPGLVVRRCDGTPLPGTRVSLVTADEDEHPLASPVDTDAEGGFDLPVDAAPDAARLHLEWTGTARLLEEGPEVEFPTINSVDVEVDVQRADFTTGVPRRIELETGWTISGTVMDGRGQPVHGARLFVEDVRSAAESGFDGTFQLQDIPADHTAVTVVAHAPGRIMGQMEVAAPPAGQCQATALIELPDCASLKGVVMLDAGTPLGDVEVCLVGASEIAPGPFLARTEPDGSFAFGGVPEGRFDLVARVDDEHAQRAGAPDAAAETWVHDVQLKCGAARDVRLVVENGVTQSGVVLDDKHRPLTNHVVAARALRAVPCHPVSWCPAASAETDGSGRFELRRLAPGAFELTVEGIPADCAHGDGGEWRQLATRGAPGALSQHGAAAGPPRPVELRREVEVAHVASDVELLVPKLGDHPEWSLLGWPSLRAHIGRGFSGPKGASMQLFDTTRRAMATSETAWSDIVLPVDSATAAGLLVFTASGRLPRVTVLHDAQLEHDFGEVPLDEAPLVEVGARDVSSGESVTCDFAVHWYGGGRAEWVDRQDGAAYATLYGDRRDGRFEVTASAPGYRRWRTSAPIPPSGEPLSISVGMVRW
jgi:hypothetical protein